jgi:para-nitrobenzyl esterase
MKKCFGIAAILIAAALGMVVSSSPAAGQLTVSCLVTTTSGDVQGVDNGSSCAFLGIPFAAPPVGGLRWKPPQPAAPWAPAMLNAIAAPPNCPSFNLAGGTIGNEDCLKLNIWTPDPAPATPAPVIVWIHTGAFQATSANFPANNGRRLAKLTGAIVVAANYRLGPFGFMGHTALTSEDAAYRSSGNYGFLDQRAGSVCPRQHRGPSVAIRQHGDWRAIGRRAQRRLMSCRRGGYQPRHHAQRVLRPDGGRSWTPSR